MLNTTTTKWVNRYAPYYSDTKRRVKIGVINQGTIIISTNVVIDEYEQIINLVNGKEVPGWIHRNDLEDYVRNYATNIVLLDDQTQNPSDFEQYVYYKSKTIQTNMCGPICIANILRLSLKEVLEGWEQKKPNFFKYIFRTGKATGTGDADLISILELHGRSSFKLSTTLYQSHISRSRYTIKGLNNLLLRGDVVMSVRINANTGLLASTGILHWINLKTILTERNGQGFVTIFNPAMNCIESYSWNELIGSAGNPYGVYVPYGDKNEIFNTKGGMVWLENRI